MSEKNVTDLRVFPYPDRERAAITVCRVQDPYGPGTGAVVSVGCTLKGQPESPTWVVHIPIELAIEVSHAIARSALPSDFEILI